LSRLFSPRCRGPFFLRKTTSPLLSAGEPTLFQGRERPPPLQKNTPSFARPRTAAALPHFFVNGNSAFSPSFFPPLSRRNAPRYQDGRPFSLSGVFFFLFLLFSKGIDSFFLYGRGVSREYDPLPEVAVNPSDDGSEPPPFSKRDFFSYAVEPWRAALFPPSLYFPLPACSSLSWSPPLFFTLPFRER